MIDMFGVVGSAGSVVGLKVENWCWRRRGVDTALERQIFITLRIRRNDEDRT